MASKQGGVGLPRFDSSETLASANCPLAHTPILPFSLGWTLTASLLVRPAAMPAVLLSQGSHHSRRSHMLGPVCDRWWCLTHLAHYALTCEPTQWWLAVAGYPTGPHTASSMSLKRDTAATCALGSRSDLHGSLGGWVEDLSGLKLRAFTKMAAGDMHALRFVNYHR